MSFNITEREPDFNKWKVADLRKELKARGLSVEGKKNELVERLQLAIGDSALLEDTNDQDEILDEDVLTMPVGVMAGETSGNKANSSTCKIVKDDEPFEESELTKVDTPEKSPDKEKSEPSLKRKSSDVSETVAKQPKKIILNRNSSTIDKDLSKTEGKENQEKIIVDTDNEKTNVVKVGALSPQERLERRAAKFGVPMSNEAKKQARAARFGMSSGGSKIGGTINTNIDVLKKRAERFGTTLPGSILETAEIEERRKKREERFGKVEKTPPTPILRGKFSLQKSSLEEKKRLRAERFKIK